MLERLVAAIVVIGLILWGGSILATPSADEPEVPIVAPDGPTERPSPEEPRAEPDANEDDRDDDDDDDDDDDRGERKKKRRGGDD